LVGTKTWKFVAGDQTIGVVHQELGDTIYALLSVVHQVLMASNGAILIGEKTIVPESIAGFARNMAALVITVEFEST
jgi:hypothetical protein